jgi:hypothetical protein
MTRSFGRVLIVFVVALLMVGTSATVLAKPAAKEKKAAPAATGADGNAVNACGCYSSGQGSCFCAKKAKCGCPGECEPKGCEEKREKEIERQVAAETKKAAEADKKQRKASADAERNSQRPRSDDKPKAAEPAPKQ